MSQICTSKTLWLQHMLLIYSVLRGIETQECQRTTDDLRHRVTRTRLGHDSDTFFSLLP
uniref:Uncharacterized protein MANES_06G035600 n=1 Tax=Rhizophora mucronata TaxID=61149 RepID=A0A2P2JZ09_RHIMU